MRTRLLVVVLLIIVCSFHLAHTQTLPLVYDVQNTGANAPKPYIPPFSELPVIHNLPDPFEWADGRGTIKNYSDWEVRRNEIGAQIENYEIGEIPPSPDSVTASYSAADSTLTVNVFVNGRSLTLTSPVIPPAGNGPFPVVIGMNSPSGSLPSNIFTSRNIIEVAFIHNEVTTYGNPQTSDPYYKLYPNLNPNNTGQYSAWAWGVSRIIDGLEIVKDSLHVDMKHIAVTGCSYAGKMALFAGAFDERVALTIAQESGGGGATSWRYSHASAGNTVEEIDNTDYNWFRDSMKQFSGDNVYRLPEDHHELMAMCAPRALYVTANPDYTWLSNPSCYVASEACKRVYDALGIGDRFGFSIVGGHLHCQVPNSQIPEIEAFVDKYLLGKSDVNTSNIADSPYNIDLGGWIPWTVPTLAGDTSFFGKTTLSSPADFSKGTDTTIALEWNRYKGARKYLVELGTDLTFTQNAKFDSTTDTTATVSGLEEGKEYLWRVEVESDSGYGPWSDPRHFTTSVPLPAIPKLVGVRQYPGRPTWYYFTWNKAEHADYYLVQTSLDSSFGNLFVGDTSSDTTKLLTDFTSGHQYYWRVRASNISGNGQWSKTAVFPEPQTAVGEEGIIPTKYSLSQNFPNPFNPTTKIVFALKERSSVTLAIYNVLGQRVKFWNGGTMDGGTYSRVVDMSRFTSGVYLYRLEAVGRNGDSFVATKKMIELK